MSLIRITAFYIITGFTVSSSGYTRHYTEFCSGGIVSQRVISPGHRELVVLVAESRKALDRGLGSSSVHTPGMIKHLVVRPTY